MTLRRVGLLYPTRLPTSPANWSGSPAGLADGLAQHGVEVVPIGTATAHPSALAFLALERAGRRDPSASRSARRIAHRTEVVRRAAAARGPLDALVAMGSDTYHLARVRPPGVLTATYDDATLLQQWHNPDSDVRGLGPAEDSVRLWCRTQAASSRAVDACCVSTSWARDSFVQDYGVRPDRVRVVGMGHRPRGASRVERDWKVPRFLMVGVDWRRKNGDAVLRAFAQVRSRHPGATLDLVGAHPPATQPGVRGHGLLRLDDQQAQARLDDLYARATAFVLPSRFDPSPIAYLEAASAGLPVVATTEGGAGELLGEAALSVSPHDDEALASAMSRLAEAEVAQRLGSLASRRATEATWPKVAGRVLEALAEAGVREIARRS